MRNKLAVGGFAVVTAFLLATNPVVVEAAGQITGAQIKNNTIASKDVKNKSLKGGDIKDGSLTASDLAAGTIPAAQIKAFKRFAADVNATDPAGGGFNFTGQTATVTVDGDDVVSALATVHLNGGAIQDDTDVAICIRPVGSAANPTVLGGATLYNNDDIDLLLDDNLLAPQAVDVPVAGSYSVGACLNNGVAVFVENVVGTATVYSGTGPLAKGVSSGKDAPGDH